MRRRSRFAVAGVSAFAVTASAVVVARAADPNQNLPVYTFCKDTFNGQLQAPMGANCPVSFESFQTSPGGATPGSETRRTSPRKAM